MVQRNLKHSWTNNKNTEIAQLIYSWQRNIRKQMRWIQTRSGIITLNNTYNWLQSKGAWKVVHILLIIRREFVRPAWQETGTGCYNFRTIESTLQPSAARRLHIVSRWRIWLTLWYTCEQHWRYTHVDGYFLVLSFYARTRHLSFPGARVISVQQQQRRHPASQCLRPQLSVCRFLSSLWAGLPKRVVRDFVVVDCL